jgi:hypothetical protein
MTDPREESSNDLEQALAAYLAAQRMTRRQLLERIAAVGAAAALAPVIAACSAGPAKETAAAQHRIVAAQAAPAGDSAPAIPPASLPAGPAPATPAAPAAPATAAASSHLISRIIARIMSRG